MRLGSSLTALVTALANSGPFALVKNSATTVVALALLLD